jgi:hypothetical protein
MGYFKRSLLFIGSLKEDPEDHKWKRLDIIHLLILFVVLLCPRVPEHRRVKLYAEVLLEVFLVCKRRLCNQPGEGSAYRTLMIQPHISLFKTSTKEKQRVHTANSQCSHLKEIPRRVRHADQFQSTPIEKASHIKIVFQHVI